MSISRRKFLTNACLACATAIVPTALLTTAASCSTTKPTSNGNHKTSNSEHKNDTNNNQSTNNNSNNNTNNVQSNEGTNGGVSNTLNPDLGERLEIRRDDFTNSNYKIVRSSLLNNSIFILKKNDLDYSAHLMKCTHNGAGLSVSGSSLMCPLHGSTFTMEGDVIKGPAKAALTSYPVVISQDKITVMLK
jgi:Rieske Fe-S protein